LLAHADIMLCLLFPLQIVSHPYATAVEKELQHSHRALYDMFSQQTLRFLLRLPFSIVQLLLDTLFSSKCVISYHHLSTFRGPFPSPNWVYLAVDGVEFRKLKFDVEISRSFIASSAFDSHIFGADGSLLDLFLADHVKCFADGTVCARSPLLYELACWCSVFVVFARQNRTSLGFSTTYRLSSTCSAPALFSDLGRLESFPNTDTKLVRFICDNQCPKRSDLVRRSYVCIPEVLLPPHLKKIFLACATV
jgi:hypothetical protein